MIKDFLIQDGPQRRPLDLSGVQRDVYQGKHQEHQAAVEKRTVFTYE